jgi:hypothetical protein
VKESEGPEAKSMSTRLPNALLGGQVPEDD